jgi:hypothetical protein
MNEGSVPGSEMIDRQLTVVLVIAAVVLSGQSLAMAQQE